MHNFSHPYPICLLSLIIYFALPSPLYPRPLTAPLHPVLLWIRTIHPSLPQFSPCNVVCSVGKGLSPFSHLDNLYSYFKANAIFYFYKTLPILLTRVTHFLPSASMKLYSFLYSYTFSYYVFMCGFSYIVLKVGDEYKCYFEISETTSV